MLNARLQSIRLSFKTFPNREMLFSAFSADSAVDSGSIWLPILFHWLTVVVWITVLGGWQKVIPQRENER